MIRLAAAVATAALALTAAPAPATAGHHNDNVDSKHTKSKSRYYGDESPGGQEGTLKITMGWRNPSYGTPIIEDIWFDFSNCDAMEDDRAYGDMRWDMWNTGNREGGVTRYRESFRRCHAHWNVEMKVAGSGCVRMNNGRYGYGEIAYYRNLADQPIGDWHFRICPKG